MAERLDFVLKVHKIVHIGVSIKTSTLLVCS